MKLLSLIAASVLASTSANARTFLYPIPQSVEWAGTTTPLSPNFRIQGIKNEHLRKAVARYLGFIEKVLQDPIAVPNGKSTVVHIEQELNGLELQVEDNRAKVDFNMDESYNLDIPEKGGYAILKARTWIGALRGLETFYQLIVANDQRERLIVHTANINDYPTYGHRGILLDTSRNFYPVKDILRTIEAQSYNKMNVLHWHATDSQSWPLFFNSHPELSGKGAYSEKETYTPQDVNTIINFAEERGIRVILEIDMPAHTASIAESHPDYMICADEFWAKYAAEPPAGQLSPINHEAFQLVKDIVKEGTSIFPDKLYHAGGDEINTACWDLEEEVVEFGKKHNLTTKEIWFQWTNRLLEFVNQDTNKRPIIWEDSIKDGGSVPQNTIVQTWLAPPSNYTSKGHDVIVSNYDYFYLDCGHGGWLGNDPRYISPAQEETKNDTFNYGGPGGSWCNPFKTWQRIYSYDMTLGQEMSFKGNILGGEVALWSEQTDYHVIDGRLWPRAASAAEVYWSGSYDSKGERRTVKAVSERFYNWVYHLQHRGINAEPVQPKYCLLHPGACDLNDPNES